MSEINAPTFNEMRQLLLKVKDKLGTDEAKSIIKQYGNAEMMVNIKPENFAAVIGACQAALNPEPDVLDQPRTVTIVENVVAARVNVPEANVFYACSTDMQDAAIQGLNNMPGGARTVEQAINAIYNAWVHAGFINHNA